MVSSGNIPSILIMGYLAGTFPLDTAGMAVYTWAAPRSVWPGRTSLGDSQPSGLAGDSRGGWRRCDRTWRPGPPGGGGMTA